MVMLSLRIRLAYQNSFGASVLRQWEPRDNSREYTLARQFIMGLLVLGFSLGSQTHGQTSASSSSDIKLNRTTRPLTLSDHADDKFWDDRFSARGPAGQITSLLIDSEGDLLAGGSFITAGAEITDLVAQWDGASWSSVGRGIMFENLTCVTCRWVNALTVDESGTVYGGGRELTDDHTFVVRLDGSSWLPVERGDWSGEVNALAADDEGHLYAGGYFYEVREQARRYVLKWDGDDWIPLGEGVNAQITAVVLDRTGGLFVGGNFDSTAGMPANRVARWDGTSWSPLGEGIAGWVQTLALNQTGHLVVGGSFETAGGVTVNNIAMWDGIAWSALGEGVDGAVNDIVLDADGNLIVGGFFETAGGEPAQNVATWDGDTWSPLKSGLDAGISALTIDEVGDIYAAGGFDSVGGEPAFGVARWDGTSWNALTAGAGQGLNGEAWAFAIGEDANLYVGGSFSIAGEIFAKNVAQWDGDSWRPLGTGLNGSVSSLALDEQGRVYAGGAHPLGNLAKWNGESWSALGGGINGSVHALALDHNGNLYAGGIFDSAGTVPVQNIAMWDGEEWSPLGQGLESSSYLSVDALAVDRDGRLFVGGKFDTAGGEEVGNIARWDGAVWYDVGGGVEPDGWIRALSFDGQGRLCAGGDFSTAGSVEAFNIAVWDGTSWSPLGSGFNSSVAALGVDNSGGLYAAGQFTALGSTGMQQGYTHVARWDGDDWFPLGSGTDREISAVAFDGEKYLYVGGRFSMAGNNPSVGIARWDVSSVLVSSIAGEPRRKTAVTLSVFPNPFTNRATLEISTEEPQHLIVSLFDVSGRRVRQLFDGFSMAPQVHRLEIDGAGLASGTYFVRIQGTSSIRTRAIALVQ